MNATDGFERSPNHTRYGGNEFELRIGSLQSVLAEQEREDFCWAASIQMILAYHGVRRSQCAIVGDLFGDCRRAQPYAVPRSQIVNALNRWTVDKGGARRSVRATSLQSSSETILTDLANDQPVLIGLRDRERNVGHVCVLQGVRYCYIAARYTPGFVYGTPAVLRARVLDPWPGVGVRSIGAREFHEQFDFAVRIYVS